MIEEIKSWSDNIWAGTIDDNERLQESNVILKSGRSLVAVDCVCVILLLGIVHLLKAKVRVHEMSNGSTTYNKVGSRSSHKHNLLVILTIA